MTLILLRHGESEGNVLRVIQGWRDYPLTERGQAQATAAAPRFKKVDATALYASPLTRAWQTALPVAAITGLDIVEAPDFREYCFGEAQGMRWDDAVARWGLSDQDWGVGRVPGEEGMATFRARVAGLFSTLAERHASDVAICVLHAGTIGAIVEELCGLPLHQHAALYTGNCGIGVFDRVDGSDIIAMLNDQRHLAPELR